jgi:curved DNA-binding protein
MLSDGTMAERDLYAILGVSRTANEKEVRAAYRQLARKYHPDRNPGDKHAEERFKEASFASSVLQDKEKRALYDEFGESGLKEGFDAERHRRYARGPSQFTNMDELFGRRRARAGGFNEVFGQDVMDALFGREAAARRGAPPTEVLAQITIEFAEAIRGVEREVSLRGGKEPERRLKVRIPAGVQDGGKVRLRGQAPDGGDIVLEVQVLEHPFFKRDGNDLLLELPITVGEAFAGGKIQIPTPSGSVSLRVPEGARGGSRLRLRNKGVRRGGTVGDLIVQLQIVLPTANDEDGKASLAKAIEQLEGAYATPPRDKLEL